MENSELYQWEPGASAPPVYPMRYSQLRYVYPESNSVMLLPSTIGLQGSEWGYNGVTAAMGDDFKPIPVGLNITWLSFAENKFYTGSFKLPQDIISALFKKGYPDFDYIANKPTISTYTEITAGMAPGGMVVVWLSGGHHRVEVACFLAHKTAVDMGEFLRRPDNKLDQTSYVNQFYTLKPEAKAYLDKHGIPEGLWLTYRERFAMRPMVTYDAHDPITTLGMDLFFYNGERDYLNEAEFEKNNYAMRARVKKLLFNWAVQWANKTQTYQLGIEFDEAEIMQAYEVVYGKEQSGQGEILIDVNNGNTSYRVFLQGNGKKIELLKAKGEIMLVR